METQTFSLPLTLLGIMAFLTGCSAQVQIDQACPTYVSEGGTLSCSCVYAAPNPPPDIRFSWLGHSNNDLIKIEKVGRALNGTDYTCEVTANGTTTTVVYTLQIAYGPVDASITGPRPIITNGTDPVTLTCLATEVNPTPEFTWTGITCINGNQGYGKDTCTFTPTPADEGKVVTCTARNSLVNPNGQTASGNFTLSVNYPPRDPPEITGFEQGQPLSSGDKLNCTVKGGNPVVALVVFSCVHPPLHDEPDEIGTDAVISSLTVNTSLASSSAMLCVCVATWTPEPGLYNQSNVANVTVDYTPPTTPAATTTAPDTTATTTTTTTTPAPTTKTASNPNPVPTSAKPSSATPTQPISANTILPSSQQTASPDTSATTKKQTVPGGSTSGGATTNPDTPSTAAGGITPGGGTGESTTPIAQPQKAGSTFPMAILGGCLGALFLLILIIIIIVYCRKRQERDVRLVNRAESTDGSYKHASDNEFYFFENNGYDRGGMQEIEPAKPVHSMPPASQHRPNSHALERTLDPYSSGPTETQEVSVRVDADDPIEENSEGRPNNAATVEEINEDPVKRTSVGMGAFSSLEKQEVSLSFPDEPVPEGSFGDPDTLPPPPSFSPDNQDLDSGEGRGHSTGPLGDVYAEVSRRHVPEDPRTETIARSVNFADDTMQDDLPDDYPSQLSTSDETLTYFP